MIKDLTFGIDCRGDYALFIEDKHFIDNGWKLDATVKELYNDARPIFFRVIENGKETSSHGWISKGEIVQWG